MPASEHLIMLLNDKKMDEFSEKHWILTPNRQSLAFFY